MRDRELTTVLKSIRRIVRAVDLHSRQIDRRLGLTLPQLVVLMAVQELGEVTVKAVSEAADLSPATVVGIMDNLENKRLLERYRSTIDRRIVHARLTDKGRQTLLAAPPPLGDAFARAFTALSAAERKETIAALDRIATLALLDADNLT